MARILVHGFYGKGNLGDELFCDALSHLFPDVEFYFSDSVPRDAESHYDALWIGGGSLLEGRPSKIITELSRTMPMAMIGVDPPSKDWEAIVERARVTLIRFRDCPDLHFAVPAEFADSESNAVAIYLNAHLVPLRRSSQWKHAGHHWFRHEFSGALEELALNQSIWMGVMSDGVWNDAWAAQEMLSLLDPALREKISIHQKGLEPAIGAEATVSLRLHAAVTAFRAGKPTVCISAHNKMRAFAEWAQIPALDYFGFRRQEFFKALEAVKNIPKAHFVATSERAYNQWLSISGVIRAKFSL